MTTSVPGRSSAELVGERARGQVVPLADAGGQNQDARHGTELRRSIQPASTALTFSTSCAGVNGFWMNGPSAPASV